MRKILYVTLAMLLVCVPFAQGQPRPSVRHTTEDGATYVDDPWEVKYANGSVTDNGDGTVSIAGGSGTECSSSACDLHVDTELNSQGICLADGTDCPAAGAGDLLADGTVPLTANWDVGNFDLTFKAATGDGTIEGAILTEGGVVVHNNDQMDASSELLAIFDDETGSASGTPLIVFNQAPVLSGKITRNLVSVNDDSCVGEQGLWWYDDTDSAFEFCNANSGAPVALPAVAGDITDVFSVSSGDANTVVVEAGESLLVDPGGEVEATEVGLNVNNDSGAIIYACTAVYISGFDIPSDLPEISIADADNAAAMPAIGLVRADIADGANGIVIVSGENENWDTAGFTVGDSVYVNDSGTSADDTCSNTLTATRPANIDDNIQKIGSVMRVHATQGEIEVSGAGRSNDMPNLESAKFWVGNVTNMFVAVSMGGEATMDNAGAVTLADSVTVTGWVMGASTATTPGADDNDKSLATTDWAETTQDYLKTSELAGAETDPNVDSEAEIEAITGALFGASKVVTAGYIWIADGTDFESVAMSSDCTIAAGGAITCDHDALDNFAAGEHFTMLDEDAMGTNSATQAATQQSIKAYVDGLTGVNESDPNVDTAAEILAILDNTALDFGTGVLTATGFVGPLTGAVTGNADTVTGLVLNGETLTMNTGALTLTPAAADSSVLTIGAGAVSVSGSNTGDNSGTDDQTLAEVLASAADANDLDITSMAKLEGVDVNTFIDMDTTDIITTKGNLIPSANGADDLGTDALEYNNAWFDGTLEADAITEGGVDVPTISSTSTFTNKRITKRVLTTASTTSWTIDGDAYDQAQQTALAGALTVNAPTGTEANGQNLIIKLTDDGTGRAITWNAAFRAIVALPTTTTASKTLYVGFKWDSTDSKWDCLATAEEP